MENLVSVDTIIGWLTKQVQEKLPIDPSTWLDAAMKINVLLQEEQEKLFALEQEVAKIRNMAIEGGDTVAKAKSRVEGSKEYLEARKQKSKVERAIEMIKISKVYARTSKDIFNS